MVICFWLSTFLVGYVYVIYPVMIWAIAWARVNKGAPNRIAGNHPLPTITVLVPAYNEEAAIAPVIRTCRQYGDVLVVDDGSTDKTKTIAEQAGAHVISTHARLGYDGVLSRAYDYALTSNHHVMLSLIHI